MPEHDAETLAEDRAWNVSRRAAIAAPSALAVEELCDYAEWFCARLAAHDAAIRAEAGAKTLEDAADEMVWRPQWGRDDYRRWLRDRAAAFRAAQPTEGES